MDKLEIIKKIKNILIEKYPNFKIEEEYISEVNEYFIIIKHENPYKLEKDDYDFIAELEDEYLYSKSIFNVHIVEEE